MKLQVLLWRRIWYERKWACLRFEGGSRDESHGQMGDRNHLLSVKKKMIAQGQAISLHNREKAASGGVHNET